jgi:aryl-alcohol dehydrogenase-like predicted oxidoreductase
MEKWATPASTAKYFQWIEIQSDKKRLFDSLSVSALGSGTYLGPADDATDRLYEQSLLKAGLSGINFFDTAINYRCMRSEKILHKVIKELAHQGVARDQIVIATKGGYLPCEGSPDAFDDYTRIHYLDTGLISSSEIVGGCHCMSSAFLENQISTSLHNLGVESIDLYYLHNPETQLQEVEEDEFYRRLTDAFRLFEKKVKERKIQRYGIATWNGFRQKSLQNTTLQLSKIIDCAKEAGGEQHHFRAIQIPYNLVMLEAVKIKNQGQGEEKKTIAEALAEQKIALMVSSPLMQSHAMHLSARVFERLPKEETAVLQSLQFLTSSSGVCTTFAGMKKLDHLQENLKLLHLANWPHPEWQKAFASVGGTPAG